MSGEASMPDCVRSLLDIVRRRDVYAVKKALADINQGGQAELLKHVGTHDETILHRVVKMSADNNILAALIDLYPNLLAESRQGSDLYRGQTALHIAITRNDVEIVELLLEKAQHAGGNTLTTIIHGGATGIRFGNTVMLAELPLAVAALTLNIDVFDKLLQYGCDICCQNSQGDTILHSLIKYAYLYPDKIAHIVNMYEHVATVLSKSDVKDTSGENAGDMPGMVVPAIHDNKDNMYVWKLNNNDGLNPLKLAAMLGQHALFKITMEMRDVYCYVNSEDGLFDVELYDVTDIDSLSSFSLIDTFTKGISEVLDNGKSEKNEKSKPEIEDTAIVRVPTLEMIFNSDPSVVFKFIELSPLRYVINRKWRFYRWFYAAWALLHVAFMVGHTMYTVRRSDVRRTNSDNETVLEYRHQIGQDAYVTVYAVLSLVVAGVYLFQELVRMYKGRMPWSVAHVYNSYHNGPFRMTLVVFSLSVLTDFIWRLVDNQYQDYVLVISAIIGWWFLVFFLRGFRQFSFFTVMIQKVLVGDMFRFSIIICMELVAFTTGLYVAYRGTMTTDENVSHYGKFMVLGFKMMFGFTSLDVLFEAPNPWFAVCLYVTFVLLTYVLMVNSLIAMMSNTCSVVSKNRDMQYRVQQLSVILFFESIFPLCWLRIVGNRHVCEIFDPKTQKHVSKTRLFMEVRSLHEVMPEKSRHRPNTETMLETIFHTVKNIQIPIMSVFDYDEDESTSGNGPVSVRRNPLRRAAGHRSSNIAGNVNTGETTIEKKHKHKKKKKHKHDDDVNVGFKQELTRVRDATVHPLDQHANTTNQPGHI